MDAGDVGELWVLDRLSRIAPVIAIHGNDDTLDAQRELPYQQVISVGGLRILLSHCHYPDRAEEMASRQNDSWHPALARRADMGKRAGASTVVFGHSHVPMATSYDEVLLVDPRAIAAPGPTLRQRIRTVALLYVTSETQPIVIHVDLAAPDRPFVPLIDVDAGFSAAFTRFVDPILEPDLAVDWTTR